MRKGPFCRGLLVDFGVEFYGFCVCVCVRFVFKGEALRASVAGIFFLVWSGDIYDRSR